MFYIEKDNEIVLADTDKNRLENTLPFMLQYEGLVIQETDKNIVYFENKFYFEDDAEYIEKQEQAEKERTGKLTMTKRVFALALQEYGISYSQLKTLIATNEQAQLEWDLCVELYRNNPLLDLMASQMGITSDQLNDMFKRANGEEN